MFPDLLIEFGTFLKSLATLADVRRLEAQLTAAELRITVLEAQLNARAVLPVADVQLNETSDDDDLYGKTQVFVTRTDPLTATQEAAAVESKSALR